MIDKVLVLPPKFTRSYLPPITADDTQIQKSIEEQYQKDMILPTTNSLTTTEYISSPQPNLIQSNISVPSDSQPIINQSITYSNIQDPIMTQSIHQSNIQQPIMTQSITSPTSIIHQTFTSSIKSNKSIMGTIPKAQPVYKLLRKGAGINPTEQQGIVFCAMTIYQDEISPISNNTAKYIKQKLGGDWIVIVYPDSKPIDFNMTCVEGNDFMYFTLDKTAFQVCRLR